MFMAKNTIYPVLSAYYNSKLPKAKFIIEFNKIKPNYNPNYLAEIIDYSKNKPSGLFTLSVLEDLLIQNKPLDLELFKSIADFVPTENTWYVYNFISNALKYGGDGASSDKIISFLSNFSNDPKDFYLPNIVNYCD